ncbi:WYL domain containing protein [uncultured Caudovirales phage]|uniref:WYL domain containing protein n=1 Tax=uncultured Caudovirales phage TaxID=2100421 RepID=A0A6J5KXW1_9CAUD|nr:WYL domain containing protein [uncultured Caudovirales phage]
MNSIDYSDDGVRNMVRSILTIAEATITFTKKDGTERVMRCTLNGGLIPSNKHPKEDSTSKPRTDAVQVVYDLDADGWRSFSWDSIIEVKA